MARALSVVLKVTPLSALSSCTRQRPVSVKVRFTVAVFGSAQPTEKYIFRKTLTANVLMDDSNRLRHVVQQ